MPTIIRMSQLYNFLRYCQVSKLGKNILDCGAGGDLPPLILFAEHGFNTYGVEIDDNQLEKVKEFESKNNTSLNIVKGNMTKLPYENESMDYAYSCNSIFHLTKKDINKAINEIKRVLKPNGRCYVNLLSVEDGEYGEGTELEKGEFMQNEGGAKVIHTYYEFNEADEMFKDMKILTKTHRLTTRYINGNSYQMAYIEYIVEK